MLRAEREPTVEMLHRHASTGEGFDQLALDLQAVSTMVRVASRLGVQRRARNVTPSLADYLQQQGAEP
jgi:hypothetical protein